MDHRLSFSTSNNMDQYTSCWDFWKCTPDLQEKCNVYKNQDGKRCWMYTDNLKVFDWVGDKRKFESCSDCPWYQHLNKGVEQA
jgi:hypothetical protein